MSPSDEMNIHHQIDKRMQYDFLRNIVRKRKRFSKWTKADKLSDIDLIKEYYGYSNAKARQVLPLINKDHLEFLKRKLYKGGR